MIRKIRKNERFLNNSEEIAILWDELVHEFNEDKDLLLIRRGVAGGGSIYADKNDDWFYKLEGFDDKIVVTEISFNYNKNKTIIKNRDDLDWFLFGK